MKSLSLFTRHWTVPIKAGALVALYLLLILEVCQFGHGGFSVLFLVSAATYGLAIVACLADDRPAFQQLTTIGWATLGLVLNWMVGWLCVPL